MYTTHRTVGSVFISILHVHMCPCVRYVVSRAVRSLTPFNRSKGEVGRHTVLYTVYFTVRYTRYWEKRRRTVQSVLKMSKKYKRHTRGI